MASQARVHRLTDERRALARMGDEVRRGLTARPKSLPPKYFYDERGSRLFAAITHLPEYYLTRAEASILERHAEAILTRTRPAELVELGAGFATKTRRLLQAGRALGCLERYVPVDVSGEAMDGAVARLAAEYPWLEIEALVADFERDLGRLGPAPGRLVAFLGSTIGNFESRSAVAFLREVRGLLGEGGYLLLGTDLVKDRATLERAYNDAQGITAEFNRNVLHVLNRELHADFVPQRFRHVALYNEEQARIEMYLEARQSHTVRLGALGLQVAFAERERLLTEISCKYTRGSVEALLETAGFELQAWWSDPQNRFALSLASPVP